MFISLSEKDRVTHLRQRGRCFNCFKIGHHLRQCPSKNRCGTCKGVHNTMIHETWVSTPKQELALVTDTQRYSLLTSPVSLSRARGSQRFFTNAIHDTGATYSFLELSAAKHLSLTGVGAPLVLNTFGESKQINSAVAVQFHLWGAQGDGFGVINALVLPEFANVKAFNWSKFQCNFTHLQDIDIPQPVGDGECHLLLGNNCGHILAPLQKARMNAGENGPIAIQTKLGWSVSGPTRMPGLGGPILTEDKTEEECKLLMFEGISFTE